MKNFSDHSSTVQDKTNGLLIFADPMFDRVIYNLIENSLRHGGDVSRITYEVRFDDSVAILTYSDDGSGVPEADKEKIFARGYGKNTGLGLFIIREILSITGLSIRECGIPGKGVRFEIRVPAGRFRRAEE